eukprot:6182425-Pleurochrysis_carterae.AAC.1
MKDVALKTGLATVTHVNQFTPKPISLLKAIQTETATLSLAQHLFSVRANRLRLRETAVGRSVLGLEAWCAQRDAALGR